MTRYPCAAHFDPNDCLLVNEEPVGSEFFGCLTFDLNGYGPIVLDRPTAAKLCMKIRSWLFEPDVEQDEQAPEFMGVS